VIVGPHSVTDRVLVGIISMDNHNEYDIVGAYREQMSMGYDYLYNRPKYVTDFIEDCDLPDSMSLKPQTIDRSLSLFDGDNLVARIPYSSIEAGIDISIYLEAYNG